jgi:NADP-dependent 3-hydroxy acid dehydrogenase YdfG
MNNAVDKPKISTAVVTGGTKGIGRAIVEHLLLAGANVLVAARGEKDLNELSAAAHARNLVVPIRTDLSQPSDVERLATAALNTVDRLDLLVHAAGAYSAGPWIDGAGDLPELFAVNVAAPIVLTTRLLPALRAGNGQIVFVNSSQGLSATKGVGAYALTKHALKAVADSLRHELNQHGIRVLTIYPGSTATPMQENVQRARGREWDPSALLQPNDVAAMVMAAITLPRTAEVTDIILRPMLKS